LPERADFPNSRQARSRKIFTFPVFHRTLVRSVPQNGHLLDRLVGVRGEMPCIGYLDEPAPAELPYASHREACAHHCVERTDRYARHEAHTRSSRATKSSPTAAPKTVQNDKARECRRRTCQRRNCGFEAGHFCGITAAFVMHRELAAARPTVLPIPILQLSVGARLSLSPSDAVSRICASRSRAFLEFDC
jgi:hypothetical protein